VSNLLALDLGTTMGWAVVRGGMLTSGVERFPQREHAHPGSRLQGFVAWLDAMKRKHPGIDRIVYERAPLAAFRSEEAARVHAQLEGLLLAHCAEWDIVVEAIHPVTLKRLVTGSSKADKQMMLSAVRMQYKGITDHNEADAVALVIATSKPWHYPQQAPPEKLTDKPF